MKTFAAVLLIAALANAKKSKKLPEIVIEPVVIEEIPDVDEQYWTNISNKNAYGRNMWLGVFQGLYGMSKKVERPDDACFGDWIPSHMRDLYDFSHSGESMW